MKALDRMHYEKFKQDEAIAAQDEAQKKGDRPEMSAPEYEALGDRYYQQGSLDMAFVQYQKALALNPEGAQLHYKQGLLFLGRGMNSEALQEFQALPEAGAPKCCSSRRHGAGFAARGPI